ncbi:MAG: tetratricopeptide repeat protein [Candidatus Hydrogenedentales bacterium]
MNEVFPLISELHQTPGLLRLLSIDALKAVMDITPPEGDLSLRIRVEAAARLWLYCGLQEDQEDCKRCLQIIEKTEGTDSAQAIDEWAKDQRLNRRYSIDDSRLSASYQNALNQLLAEWKNAHGAGVFIKKKSSSLPVATAAILPFIISDNELSAPTVHTKDRLPLNLLKDGVVHGFLTAKSSKFKNPTVTFNTLVGECGDLLSEESLGLAIVTAMERQEKDDDDGSLKCLASGVLTDTVLCSGEEEFYLKKYHLMKKVNPKKIFLPEFGVKPEDKCRDIFINPAEMKEEVQRHIADINHPHIDDLQNEVGKISSRILIGCIDHKKAENRLNQILSLVDENECSNNKKDKVRALAQLHLAAVYNHLGKPTLAKNCIQKVLQSRLSDNEKAWAFIRFAVTLTDFQDYEEALEALNEAERRIPNDYEKDERLMQLYGTRGQVYMYKGLRSHRPEDRDKAYSEAYSCFKKALDSAETDKDRDQDKTYIYLAKAFYRPRDITKTFIEQKYPISETSESRPFFIRSLWLAPYRAFLEGIQGVFLPNSYSIPSQDKNIAWVYATTLKYRGTLFAAAGDYEKAHKDFESATNQLKDSKAFIQIIYLSVLVQAGESLKVGLPDKAKIYLDTAKTLNIDEEWENRARPWQDRAAYLLGEKETAENPQLYFPY